MNVHEVVVGRPVATKRTEYQEYPKSMFGPNGEVQTVKTKEEEDSLLEHGFAETRPPQAADAVEVINQPRTGGEMVALKEAREKFTAIYNALAAEHEELAESHSSLMEAHNNLQEQYSALLVENEKFKTAATLNKPGPKRQEKLEEAPAPVA